MQKIKTHFPTVGMLSKFRVGPTSPKPGPTEDKQATTDDMPDMKSNPTATMATEARAKTIM
jgi:hypothetical protein